MSSEPRTIGGQALIDGVLIKTHARVSMASATKHGIRIHAKDYVSWTKRHAILGIPFIRGAIVLAEMIWIGVQALAWSAEDTEKVVRKKNERESSLNKFSLLLSVFAAVFLALILFVGLPYLLTQLIIQNPGIVFSLVDGVIRVAVFVAYVSILRCVPDIRRTFQYHGAEHKAIHCYEAGKPLTVKNVQQFSPLHHRCGTSLVLIVFLISILLFALVKFDSWYWNVLLRVLALPLVAGFSYEFIKLSSKHASGLTEIAATPGLWLQHITTAEPTNNQVKVAIAAVKNAL